MKRLIKCVVLCSKGVFLNHSTHTEISRNFKRKIARSFYHIYLGIFIVFIYYSIILYFLSFSNDIAKKERIFLYYHGEVMLKVNYYALLYNYILK